MESNPLVTILVPICNTKRYLRDCLDSIATQTLESLQIICIDDGSTDESPIILKEFAERDPRIEVVTKQNSGYGDSMNIGLSRAKGEYIGIVESDDFVEAEMFEALYLFAKSNDADVVKSNFMYHESGADPHLDPVVRNIQNVPFDTLFNPLVYQDIFLTQPAIWSAVYKRSFLLDNDIKFLPTPGASFQDTSFNFKVFSAARRAVVVEEAFLHYRIDNANSSVKSQEKIFCVCEEYDEIWRFAKLDTIRYESLKHRIPQIQFGGYQWNLDRLIEPLRPLFYDRFVSDFQDIESQGLLNADYFDEIAWNRLDLMLADPESYFQDSYGPKDVQRTYVVRFSGEAKNDISHYINDLLSRTSEEDEIVFYLINPSKEQDREARRLQSGAGRLFGSENLFESAAFEILDKTRLRGKEVVFLNIEPSIASISGDQTVLDAVHARRHNKESLIGMCLPLVVPLAVTGFYDALISGDSIEKDSIPEYFPLIEYDEVSLKEYEIGLAAYIAFSRIASDAFGEHSSQKNTEILKVVIPFWNLLKEAYSKLTYDDRLKLGKRPSALDFPAVHYEAKVNIDASIDVSVIVPVYNAEVFLRECMDSVLAQEVSIEIICIDDGSTDSSLSILRSYAERDSRLKLVSQLNGGAGAARNRGISLARGEYLAFIDPDDYYPSKSCLSSLVSAAKANKALIAGGTLELVDPLGNPLSDTLMGMSFYTFKATGLSEFSDYENDYGWIRFLYHRSIFEDKMIRFPETRFYEDPVFFMKVMQEVHQYWSLPEPVYSYRLQHKEQTWSDSKIRDLLAGISCNLDASRRLGWRNLYSLLIKRLDFDYCEAIYKHLGDEEVFAKMMHIQTSLNMQMINFVRDRGSLFHLLRAFELDRAPDLALTRLSKRIEKTSVYEMLQNARRMMRTVVEAVSK